jgi:hypothetical protein
MKRRILAGTGLIALTAFLAGCDEIKFNGMFGIHETMTFAQEMADPYDPNPNPDWLSGKQAGNIIVSPGNFSTAITLGGSNEEKEIKLEIKNGPKPTVIELKFDKDIEIGEHFILTAAQLKQNFDLAGDIATKITQSPEQSGNESCYYQAQEWVCRAEKTGETTDSVAYAELEAANPEPGAASDKAPFPVPYPSPYPGQYPGNYPAPYPPGYHPGPYPGPNCHTIWVTRPGYQYVRYYYETTVRDITARFLQGDKTLADYQGKASSTEQKYTYRDACR